jgi:putative ABC transport system permease protein
MIKNYFKIAWRNLKKNKVYSTINIFGLATGIAACLVIFLFVLYEKSFDSMHSKNIVRLNEIQKFEGMVKPQNVALSMYPMGPTLKNEFPEVKNFTRIIQTHKMEIRNQGTKIFLPSVLYADSTFLKLFDFQIIEGDRNTLLDKINSIVLTQKSAKKIFGDENPIGKSVTKYANDTTIYTVTGILKDIPENSHLQFDGLVSLITEVSNENINNWAGNWMITYLELEQGTNIASLEKKFPAYLKKHMVEDDGWKYYHLFLQPLTDVHSGSTTITHDYVNYQKFDENYTYIFSIIAFVILLIACINFINLSTARSAERAREVGIRKTIGAERFQLTGQFLGESILMAFFALFIALAIVKLALPSINNLSQRHLELPLTEFSFLLLLIGGTGMVGLIAGLYPASYLSSFNPTRVLKGSFQTKKSKINLRNALVIGQFTGAILLIIGTVFSLRQLDFMQKANTGFDREQVMIVPLNRNTTENYNTLKQELLKNTAINSVSAAQQTLGNNLHQAGVVFHGSGAARELTISQVIVDSDYLRLYKIPIIAGRNFEASARDYGKAYIINETLAKELLKDTPKAPLETLIGKKFGFEGMDSTGFIAGVAKDFNFNSLHHKIETLSIFCQKEWGYSEAAIRINKTDINDAVNIVEKTWKKINPNQPFEYKFLDDHFSELYRADQIVSKVVGILTGLAILISCLGLFGLTTYAAEKRIKEIGIRKVMGASVLNITTMLSKDFIRLVIIANLVAWPIAWFGVNRWLQDFAFRVSINWWIFVLAGTSTLIITVLTVSYQAVKAALMNPVKSLKVE